MTETPLVLFVDDDATIRETAGYTLGAEGFSVATASSGDEAKSLIQKKMPSLLVTDVRMPGMSGIELLDWVHKENPSLPVVLITAFADVQLAVEAMKRGASDFLPKPFAGDHLVMTVRKCLETLRLRQENRRLRGRASGVERPIHYRSQSMEALLRTADRVAGSDATVLISGESGTGKELIARRIHARSERVDRPFVVVNCAAISPNLVESELFGHERGAFSGAQTSRKGRIRQAEGGTVFLDEIGELPVEIQARLLRTLQEGNVDPVGADSPVPVNVRFVAATHRNLESEISAGRFREDLYYRLNVIRLVIPPLRNRPEDIEHLTRILVGEFAQDLDLSIPTEVLAYLKKQQWPGNVRELRNACERMVLLSGGHELEISHLEASSPHHKSQSSVNLPPDGVSLFDLEQTVIREALERNQWNVSKAAEFLRVPRHILAYRIEKYGIVR